MTSVEKEQKSPIQFRVGKAYDASAPYKHLGHIFRKSGFAAEFTRLESGTSQILGSEDPTILPEGFIVNAKANGILGSKVDSLRLQRGLQSILKQGELDPASIYRTPKGVWIGYESVREFNDYIKNSPDPLAQETRMAEFCNEALSKGKPLLAGRN